MFNIDFHPGVLPCLRLPDVQFRQGIPIGIEIGAETPEEIAISILAEITRVKRTEKNLGE